MSPTENKEYIKNLIEEEIRDNLTLVVDDSYGYSDTHYIRVKILYKGKLIDESSIDIG